MNQIKQILSTAVGLFGHKRWQSAVATVIVLFAVAFFGEDTGLSEEKVITLMQSVAAIGALVIGAFGLGAHGKEKAEIQGISVGEFTEGVLEESGH